MTLIPTQSAFAVWHTPTREIDGVVAKVDNLSTRVNARWGDTRAIADD